MSKYDSNLPGLPGGPGSYKIPIPTLDETNYPAWASQMRRVLTVYGLAKTIDSEVKAEHETMNQRIHAHTIIFGTLSRRLQATYHAVHDPGTLWKKLESWHSTNSLQDIIRLQDEMAACK